MASWRPDKPSPPASHPEVWVLIGILVVVLLANLSHQGGVW